MMWSPAYVAIGSNLSGPARQVQLAFERLAGIPQSKLVLKSRLYRTAPIGPQDQPEFVNACAGLVTQLSPEAMLAALRDMERSLGKVPPPMRWGPRVIDLDLLILGDERRETPELRLPHPHMHERSFVLYPLADVAPSLRVPGHGRVADLAQRAGRQGLEWL